jgi:hypothetical protein
MIGMDVDGIGVLNVKKYYVNLGKNINYIL